jgi:hypothetical protein
MGNEGLREALLWGGIGLKVFFLAKLLWLRLAIRYRTLTAYLLFSLFRSAILILLDRSGSRILGLSGYNLVWVATQPVLWLLYFLIILEIYSIMLQDFQGIVQLGRFVLLAGVGAATLGCWLLVTVGGRAGPFRYPFLAYLALQERGVFFCLSAAMLIVVAFASYYRIRPARNVRVLCASFGGYFIVNGIFLVLYRFVGDDFLVSRTVLNGFSYCLALLGAAACISAAGEVAADSAAPPAEPDANLERALSLQLESFNQALVRVFRR